MSEWICRRCGKIVDEDEIGHHDELVGECWGFPAYETWMDDCSCGGQFIPYEEENEGDDEE